MPPLPDMMAGFFWKKSPREDCPALLVVTFEDEAVEFEFEGVVLGAAWPKAPTSNVLDRCKDIRLEEPFVCAGVSAVSKNSLS